MIELLAVVTILGVVASLGLTRLAAADAQAAINEALARVQDLDARARLAARRGSAAVINIEHDGSMWTLIVSDAQVAQIRFSPTIEARAQIDHRSITRIAFDRLGRSDDYSILLDHDQRTLQFAVYGLTGVFVTEGAAP